MASLLALTWWQKRVRILTCEVFSIIMPCQHQGNLNTPNLNGILFVFALPHRLCFHVEMMSQWFGSPGTLGACSSVGGCWNQTVSMDKVLCHQLRVSETVANGITFGSHTLCGMIMANVKDLFMLAPVVG